MLFAIFEHDDFQHVRQAAAVCFCSRCEHALDLRVDPQGQSRRLGLAASHMLLLAEFARGTQSDCVLQSEYEEMSEGATPRKWSVLYVAQCFCGLSGDALALGVGIAASMKLQIDLAKSTAFCIPVFGRLLLVSRPARVTHRPTGACQRGAARIGPWITRLVRTPHR